MRTGLGHVRRTVTLAAALRRAGIRAQFCFAGDAEAGRLIREAGFDLVDVTKDPDATVEVVRRLTSQLVIVDAREVAGDEHRRLRAAVGRIAVIDDLGDRPIAADMILNSNLYAHELSYPRTDGTMLLLGPRYALLREVFATEPQRQTLSTVRRLLIALGGSDPAVLTPRLVRWTRAECPGAEIVVVAGPLIDHVQDIRAAGPDEVLVNPPEMHDVMLRADLTVSGGGQTTYELAATACAALGIQIADDQQRNLEALSRAGVLVFVGEVTDPDLETRFRHHLASLAVSPAAREQMGDKGRSLVDGRGADRVAAAIAALA